MNLLTAVNRILPVLGEHPVTTIDARHPTLAILLPKVETKIEDLTSQGYWFNTFAHTLYPDAEGNVALPSETLAFTPDRAQGVQRGTRLYNAETLSYVFTEAVPGKLITRLDFDELPEVVAQAVWYNVLVDAYVTDIGLESTVQMWMSQAKEAEKRMLSEHLRNMRYSTTKSPRFQRIRRAIRGH